MWDCGSVPLVLVFKSGASTSSGLCLDPCPTHCVLITVSPQYPLLMCLLCHVLCVFRLQAPSIATSLISAQLRTLWLIFTGSITTLVMMAWVVSPYCLLPWSSPPPFRKFSFDYSWTKSLSSPIVDYLFVLPASGVEQRYFTPSICQPRVGPRASHIPILFLVSIKSEYLDTVSCGIAIGSKP